jgi:hypothetical protein
VNYGVGRAFIVRILAILVFLGAMGATAALEPDGPVVFRPVWSEPDRAMRDAELRGPGAELRLGVIPGVGLRESALEVRLPHGIAVAPGGVALDAGVRTELERDGTTVLRIELGRIDPGSERPLRIRLRLDGAEGAVATFVLRGTDDRGVAIRDAIGVVVGVPGAAPDHRHGAIEYRAVPIPDPNGSLP